MQASKTKNKQERYYRGSLMQDPNSDQNDSVYMPMHRRLSFKQMRNTVLIALTIGFLLSCMQILHDYSNVERESRGLVDQVLNTLQQPAAEAAYGLDETLAKRVTDGLFEYRPIYFAEIRDDFGNVLAREERAKTKDKHEWLTNLIFDDISETPHPLILDGQEKVVGEIRVKVDRYVMAADFIERSKLVILMGVIRNIALAGFLMAMFYMSITKPFMEMTRELSLVNPARPIERPINVPKGHEDDELGLLARTTNGLLEQFEHSLDENKKVQEKLSERETRLSGIMNNVADAIITIDDEGIIEDLNPASLRLFDVEKDQAIGASFSTLVTDFDWEGLAMVLTNYRVRNDPDILAHAPEEITGRRQDGSTVALSLSITEMKLSEHYARFIFVVRDITQRKQFEEQLMYMATHDPLTDLPNRTLLQDRISHALTHARRKRTSVAVLFLDLDRFKLVNDTLGHDIGDRLLESVALRLTNTVRSSDTVGRLGGDEFLIIADDMEAPTVAARVAENILEVLNRPFNIEGNQLFITPSIGISVYPGDGTDIQTLLRHADTAMYSAKNEGGNTYQFFIHKMNQEAVTRLSLERNLREALEKDQFELYFQPKARVDDLMPVGVEALIRWRHPDLGFVSPTDFIPIAEETGLILPIGDWVLRAALQQIKSWQEQGRTVLPIAINLSARQLTQEQPVIGIKRQLEYFNVDPCYLELEITETIMMGSLNRTVEILGEFRSMGLKISIDDFGTGYSSLSYLRRLPIDSLKIDRSFIDEVNSNPDDAAIASTIIAMGRKLSLNVIAEGIETPEQLEFLRDQECGTIQGYWMAKPMPAKELEKWLDEGAKPIGSALEMS